MYKVVILSFFLITGCGMNLGCIGNSDITSSAVSSVEVPVTVDNNKLWVDSHIDFKEGSTIKLTIAESVNLCPRDSLENRTQVIPAVFCKNSTMNATSDEIDKFYKGIDETDIANKKRLKDPKELCRFHGQKKNGVDDAPSEFGRYVSLNTTVNPGDSLFFDLVAKKITVTDCSLSELRKQGILFDPDNTYFSDKTCQNAVPSQTVCEAGGPVFLKIFDPQKGTYVCTPVPMETEIMKYKSFEVIVGNNFSPYSNLASIYSPKSENEAKREPFLDNNIVLDLRMIKPDISKYENELKGKVNERECHIIYTNKPLEADKKNIANEIKNNFSMYNLNCHCNRIMRGDQSNTVDDNALLSYKYDLKNQGDKKCSIKSNDMELDPGKHVKRAMGLIAKVGDENIDFNSKVVQFLPGTVQDPGKACDAGVCNFDNYSLRLNHEYKINNNVPANSTIMMMVVDQNGQYFDNFGGYNVRVKKSCIADRGNKLYMYIGDEKPTKKPGDSGTTELITTTNGEYTIDSTNSVKSGRIYFAIDVGGRNENQFLNLPSSFPANRYVVNLHVSDLKWNPLVSNFFTKIKNEILNILYGTKLNSNSNVSISSAINSSPNDKGAVRQIYNHTTTSQPFFKAVRVFCMLYIMFSSLGYVLGVIRISTADLLIRIIKMALVISLFSQNSWQFFSDHFFSLFVQGVDQLIGIFSSYIDSDENSFQFLDPTLGRLFSGETWLKFFALLLSGPLGWLVFIFVMWSAIIFFIAAFEAMLMYLQIIVTIAFLLTLTPLFLVFLLFNFTKDLFDSWIRLLVKFSLHPILLFSSFAFLNQVVMTSLAEITDYPACSQCTFGIKVYANDEGELCLFQSLFPVGFSNNMDIHDRIHEEQSSKGNSFFGLPFSIVTVLILLICTNAMRIFVKLSEAISMSISNALGGLQGSFISASQSLLSVVGLDQQTQHLIANIKRYDNQAKTKVQFRNSAKRNVGNNTKGYEDNSNKNDAMNSAENNSVENNSVENNSNNSADTNNQPRP